MTDPERITESGIDAARPGRRDTDEEDRPVTRRDRLAAALHDAQIECPTNHGAGDSGSAHQKDADHLLLQGPCDVPLATVRPGPGRLGAAASPGPAAPPSSPALSAVPRRDLRLRV
ncbi:MAG: hypothetical protein WCH74_12165, partial [Chloroflexota bacterium]